MAVKNKVVKKASTRGEPPQPPKLPIVISTTPKPMNADLAQRNAREIAKFNKAEPRRAAKEVRSNARNSAKVARINQQIADRAARKQLAPQPRSGPKGGSGGSSLYARLTGSGLRKHGR